MTERQIFEKFWYKYPYLFRNNRGMCWQGKPIKRGDDRMIQNARPVYYGIPETSKKKGMKGGDYIGFREVAITEDMVGQTIAQFMNVEIKTKTDRIHKNQRRWHDFVKQHGGHSEFWVEGEDGVEVEE